MMRLLYERRRVGDIPRDFRRWVGPAGANYSREGKISFQIWSSHSL